MTDITTNPNVQVCVGCFEQLHPKCDVALHVTSP